MTTTSTERMRETRSRRRQGLVLVKVPVSHQDIEFLAKRGYEAKKDDPASISEAISMFLSDSAYDAGYEGS